MMNKLMKKVAIVLAAATMAIAGTTIAASANDGMGIEAVTPGVSVQDISAVKYVVPTVGANVRTAPSTSAKVIRTLGFNEKVQVTGKTSNGWYQIRTTDPVYGGEGAYYVAGDLLSDSKQEAPAQTGVNQTYTWIKETHSANTSREKAARGEMSHDNDTFTACVSYGYLALRSSAVTDPANEIGQISNGSMVQVQSYGEQFDYVYVPSLDMYGYVNNDYLA